MGEEVLRIVYPLGGNLQKCRILGRLHWYFTCGKHPAAADPNQ